MVCRQKRVQLLICPCHQIDRRSMEECTMRAIQSRVCAAFGAAARVIGRAVPCTVTVAVVAGLYGVLYGFLDGLVHADPGRVVSAGLYFAFCGAMAGALIDSFGRMIDPEGVADLTCRRAKPSVLPGTQLNIAAMRPGTNSLARTAARRPSHSAHGRVVSE